MPIQALLRDVIYFRTQDAHPQPDGRPLYDYRCSDRRYQMAQDLVKTHLPRAMVGRASLGFDRLFCLYAAETWKRRYTGGPWGYDVIFSNLFEEIPNLRGWIPQNQEMIRYWICEGLRWWGRELIVINRATRYLASIATEAGLPSLVLLNNANRLRDFFTRCSVALSATPNEQPFDALATVNRLAIEMNMPQSIRNEVFVRLTVDLINKILELREKVKDSIDPIHALDSENPLWRRGLPIAGIPEEALRVLIDPIISLPQGNRPLRWHCLLNNHLQGWKIIRKLSFPTRVSAEWLLHRLGDQELAVRLWLILDVSGQKRRVADLTRTTNNAEGAEWYCNIGGDGVIITGIDALKDLELSISDGMREYPLVVEGSQGLGDFNWVFIEKAGGKILRFEGSCDVTQETAWVVTPSGTECSAANEEVSKYLSKIEEINRDVYQLQGQASFRLPDGESFNVRSQSVRESGASYVLIGGKLQIGLDDHPTYLGHPNLQPNEFGVEWRSVHDPAAPWSRDLQQCWGTVWLRSRDRQGMLRFRQRIHVLPAGIQFTVLPNEIHLDGLRGATLVFPNIDGLTVQWQSDLGGNSGILSFAVIADRLPATSYPLQFEWSNQRRLTVQLPVPCVGGAFSEGTRILANNATVALSRLGTISAVAQSANAGGWCVEAEVQGADAVLRQVLWHRMLLVSRGNGRFEAGLHMLQEPLDTMMSLTNNLDASAILTIRRPPTDYSRLRVSRFDAELTPDQLQNRVLLLDDIQANLEAGWEDRITISIRNLCSPEDPAIILERQQHTDEIAWVIPEGLSSGPWWILGTDGYWARFRPLLWTIKDGDDVVADDANCLADAVRIADHEQRRMSIARVVEALSSDTNHSDWRKLFGYVELVRDYPASTLDVLRVMSSNSDALCLALIKATSEQFDAVWNLSSQLPFSWSLIPPHSWLRAATEHYGKLREAYEKVNLDVEGCFDQFKSFGERLQSKQSSFKGLFAWLSVELPYNYQIEDAIYLHLAGIQPDKFENELLIAQEAMQGRHDENEQRPTVPRLLEIVTELPVDRRYQSRHDSWRGVLCAPFVAAHISLTDRDFDHATLLEMNRVRAFDPKWFDDAYTIALYFSYAALLAQ